MPAAAPSRPISATIAPARCPDSPPRGVAAGRSPPRRSRFPHFANNLSSGTSGAVGAPLYDEAMALSLIAGPANAGKVELLLDRYLASLDRKPTLIVPNRSDVDRVERDLLDRRPCLLAGSIGTFDDVFERIARGREGSRPLVSQAQRALLVRSVVAGAALDGLAASARFNGFAEALLEALGELESGLLEPEQLDGELATLYGAYRVALDRLGLWDRNLLRRRAAERLQSDLDAWHDEPVLAYGFEDLTGAEWALLEALAAR